MPDDPIIIRNGTYQEYGEHAVMGVCIFLDDQNDEWDVAETENDITLITIKKGAKWKVEEYTDPVTHKKKVQIFCEGGNMNSVVLQHFVNPDGNVHIPNGTPPNGELPMAKVIYTTNHQDGSA